VLKNYAEWQIDERIIAEIIQADVTQAGGSIDDIQAINAAHEFMKIKERQETMAERREIAQDVAKLGLSMNYARHNGKLLFDPNA
jgi:RNA-binding protein YhbY